MPLPHATRDSPSKPSDGALRIGATQQGKPHEHTVSTCHVQAFSVLGRPDILGQPVVFYQPACEIQPALVEAQLDSDGAALQARTQY